MEINFKTKVDKLKADLLDSYYNTDSRDLQNKAMWQLDFLNEKVRPMLNLALFHVVELESCVARKEKYIDELHLRIRELEEQNKTLLIEKSVID